MTIQHMTRATLAATLIASFSHAALADMPPPTSKYRTATPSLSKPSAWVRLPTCVKPRTTAPWAGYLKAHTLH